MRFAALLTVLLLMQLTAAPNALAVSAGAPTPFGLGEELPLQVRTEKREGALVTELSATLNHPYSAVRQTLARGQNLCDIAPLHFNIKACTHQSASANTLLTFFSGRKHFQVPEDTWSYTFQYHIVHDDTRRFEARLTPIGEARRYVTEPLVLHARPRAPGTNIEVSFAYRDSLWLRIAAESYFATLGRGKTGFSVTGTDAAGRPVHTEGIQGALERNAVRYYFALDAFLTTRNVSEPARFESRLNQWFDRTEKFPAQLHEMDRNNYLSYKRRERAEQLRLQGAITAAALEG